MLDCCHCQEYEEVFDGQRAAGDAARYRKQGLNATAEHILSFLQARGVESLSVLEVGGGIGDLQIELLRAGATGTINVELSPAYEATAAELLQESKLQDRVERRVADFVAAAGTLPDADIVIMNMVVCCYPNMKRLVEAATAKARRYLALSFPRDIWLLSDLMALAINIPPRLRGSDFRFFVHPPRAILGTAAASGLQLQRDERGYFRRVTLLSRPAWA